MPREPRISITPDRPILVAEVAAAAGVSERRVNRLIDDSILPRSVSVKIGARRALRAFAVPMVRFGASDGAKLSKATRLEAMRLIETYTKANWHRLCREPGQAATLQFESGCLVVTLGETVSAAMAGLNRLGAALDRVVADPDVRAGLPVLRGTRIGAHEIADALACDGMAAVLQDYPTLTKEDVEAGVLYARAHPRSGRPRANDRRRRLIAEKAIPPSGSV